MNIQPSAEKQHQLETLPVRTLLSLVLDVRLVRSAKVSSGPTIINPGLHRGYHVLGTFYLVSYSRLGLFSSVCFPSLCPLRFIIIIVFLLASVGNTTFQYSC